VLGRSGQDGLEACPGCGDRLPPLDGATHPYVGASSACWVRFAEVSATLPQGGTPLRRLVSDAFMVQHPGVPERRSIQSVGVHLVGLHLVLELGLRPEDLSATLQRLLTRPPAWRWLEPPEPNGPLTIASLEAATAEPPLALDRAIDAYVRGVWAAWSAHRGQIVVWAGAGTISP
jgi:hypothetical protein